MLDTLPSALLATYASLLGLVVGSYLNVVAYRLPRGQSTVAPRSRCPSCQEVIRAHDNIPVLSFLLLRGRCRHCGARISLRYPLVESLTGLLFLACYLTFGNQPSTLIAALFCSLLVVLALTDLDHLLLPNRITYPGIVAGVALSPLAVWTTFPSSIWGAILGAGLLLLLIGLWYLARGELGMGLGDPKMLAMIGAFLGLSKVLLCLLVASLLGTLVSGVLFLRGRAGLGTKLPFGLYLAVAGGLGLFFGTPVISWYASLL